MTDDQEPLDESTEENSEYVPAQTQTKRGGFKAGPFAIVAILVVFFAFVQVQRKILNRTDDSEDAQHELMSEDTVGLTVQIANKGQLPLYETPWTPGMTVRDLMRAARREGRLTFDETGEDDGAMLIAINETKNEGGSPENHNWIFRVNGKPGDKSFGIYELQKGDIVSWKFGPYE